MQSDRRQRLLKIAVGVIVGLFVLDRAIISPAMTRWRDQSERIATLREKVARGNQLMEREDGIRTKWAEMVRGDLPADLSAAESDVYKAIARWARDSRISFTSLTPQWRNNEGFDTLECRASASGDQASLGRFLYELETDTMPVHLQECEISTRDAQGRQLMLTARFSFLRLSERARKTR